MCLSEKTISIYFKNYILQNRLCKVFGSCYIKAQLGEFRIRNAALRFHIFLAFVVVVVVFVVFPHTICVFIIFISFFFIKY